MAVVKWSLKIFYMSLKLNKKINSLISENLIIKGIIYVNIFFFGISLLISGKKINMSLNPFTMLSPSIESIIFLGGSGTVPINHYHQWWSLISANWLHGSILHILFNMTALLQIAPLIVREYGINRMFIIYTISGISGFLLSYFAGVKLTIGASGAICGLIGSALYYGKSRGGVFGEAVFKQTSTWIFFLILFGLAIPNINNWGHGAGLVSGIFLGWLLGYNEKKKEQIIHNFFSIFCIIATFLILIWAIASAFG